MPEETCAPRSPISASGVRTLRRMIWNRVSFGLPSSYSFIVGIQSPSSWMSRAPEPMP